jgi:hypothetical protein
LIRTPIVGSRLLRTIRILSAGFLTLVAVVLLLTGWLKGFPFLPFLPTPPAQPPPTFKVSRSLPAYGPEADVSLGLELSLPAASPRAWTVPTESVGTITVVSLKKDRVKINPSSFDIVDFLDDPRYMIARSLASLKPGASLVLKSPDCRRNQGGLSRKLTLFAFQPSDVGRGLDQVVPTRKNAESEVPPTRKNAKSQLPKSGAVSPGAKTTINLPSPIYAWRYVLPSPGTYSLTLAYQYEGSSNDPADAFTDRIISNEVTFKLQ